MKKFVPIVIIGILLCTAFGVAAFKAEDKTHDGQSKGSPPLVFVFGVHGNNSWYISDVNISFQYDPSDVKEIWYKIGTTYVKYSEKFTVSTDGIHNIPWYWIDKNGSRWDGLPIVFKIDKTPPINELSKQKLSKTEVKFTAAASDSASEIEKVEFYCDDVLKSTDTVGPSYEWTWTGTENQQVYAIAYNYAGYSKESNTLPTPLSYVPHLFMLLRLLMQRLLLIG